ncbi:MAG: 3-isopropylmalate dehydratase [Fusobacteriaceae bacterium]|jgi:3-isopropylmalate/(R)-2-methylmalate dehydratase small subunit|nr:3-isopropylmalate dehydratase [Fusobacteriaceae bacterium]
MEAHKAWKYGNNINTDIISPAAYMEYTIEDAKKYTMATIDTEFGTACRPDDIFVAEHNLGSGSSRETAPLMLKALGVRYVVAMDFARIFYRNCFNVGLVPVECASTDKIHMGDMLSVDVDEGIIYNLTTKENLPCGKIPTHIKEIADCGGLLEYIKAKRAE